MRFHQTCAPSCNTSATARTTPSVSSLSLSVPKSHWSSGGAGGSAGGRDSELSNGGAGGAGGVHSRSWRRARAS
eukprot:scaffold18942_cov63-Phaeocystis_antarctica.AAC.11